MENIVVIQGRELTAGDIDLIQSLQAEHGDWGRTRLSEELCRRWDWRNGRGQSKDMAARTLLLKLERRGRIRLPARLHQSTGRWRKPAAAPPVGESAPGPIIGALADLRPLAVSVVAAGSPEQRVFHALLARHHYLGHRRTVGENLGYLVRDRAGRAVACALFGSRTMSSTVGRSQLRWSTCSGPRFSVKVVLPLRRTPQSQTMGASRHAALMRCCQKGLGIMPAQDAFGSTKSKVW